MTSIWYKNVKCSNCFQLTEDAKLSSWGYRPLDPTPQQEKERNEQLRAVLLGTWRTGNKK